MMSPLVVVIGFVAMCSASPSLYFSGPQYYSGYYAAPAAVVSPIKSQYHTQNEFGQYAYGYNDGFSSKSETKHANGLTEGAYSYVDPNGVLQQYKYVSDENGYRVSGTNLPVAPAVPAVEVPAVPAVPAVESVIEVKAAAPAPAPEAVSYQSEIPQQVQDTPEVAAAKAAHQIAYDEAKKAADASPAEDEPSSDAVVQVSADASAAPAAPAAPAAAPAAPAADFANHYAPAPVVAAAPAPVASFSYHPAAAYAAYPSYAAVPAHAPVASYAYGPVASYAYAPAPAYAYSAPFASGSYSPVHSQYHSQDEFGQYSYGYNSGSSSKAEVKTLDGVTRGGYSYVDANGQVQHYNYVSDSVNGFRVAGTNLPAANAL
ncbi:cuticle protein-like [Myzus persicae]|uniref:cuticle protein-like n=1 Tax=Myzus persicae TaxID=13164 RepID=UPI000B938131|nr:cuticle protein-like [Myzus persicae]